MHLKLSSAKWRPFCPGGRCVKISATSPMVQWVTNHPCLLKRPTAVILVTTNKVGVSIVISCNNIFPVDDPIARQKQAICLFRLPLGDQPTPFSRLRADNWVSSVIRYTAELVIYDMWALWRLKSPSPRLLVQQLVQVDNTGTSSYASLALCEGNPPGSGERLPDYQWSDPKGYG